jgi:hypothetical protein
MAGGNAGHSFLGSFLGSGLVFQHFPGARVQDLTPEVLKYKI